jgi:hypothetical protein
MTPFLESFQLKKSQKCLKTMFERPHANKWDKRKNANLKE